MFSEKISLCIIVFHLQAGNSACEIYSRSCLSVCRSLPVSLLYRKKGLNNISKHDLWEELLEFVRNSSFE